MNEKLDFIPFGYKFQFKDDHENSLILHVKGATVDQAVTSSIIFLREVIEQIKQRHNVDNETVAYKQ